MPIKSAFGHFVTPVENKTADYTITTKDFGKLLTNNGAAGAVNFTLPAAAAALIGSWVKIAVVTDQTVTITSNPIDTLIAFNDIAADSIAFSTAAEKVGNVVLCTCVSATKWLAEVNLGAETATPTIAT